MMVEASETLFIAFVWVCAGFVFGSGLDSFGSRFSHESVAYNGDRSAPVRAQLKAIAGPVAGKCSLESSISCGGCVRP